MEWISIRNQSAGVTEYQLMDANSTIAILKYNIHQQTIRLQAENNRAVFFIEKAGGLFNKTIINNEYGLPIGKISVDKKTSRLESLELEGRKFYYSFQNDPFAELILYKSKSVAPVARCGIKAGTDNLPIVFNKSNHEEFIPVLLGLCWYSFFISEPIRPVLAHQY
ncbi:MAG: hypothetical protein JST75_16185 [Bacteroidetes bacterium]|nr:hypothetical protein [Bacteroidota bacterium]